METEVFSAGVRPGGPTTKDEVKILICYILSEINASMSFEQLHESLLEHELVNYFELVAAVDSLERTGHIKIGAKCEPAVYAATKLGRSTAGEMGGLISNSVRQKAVEAATKLLKRKKREREVRVEITESDSGCTVGLALPESGMDLIGFSVFCPTREEAELVRRRFLNDPVYIYKNVMALLIGDKSVVGEIHPAEEKLF